MGKGYVLKRCISLYRKKKEELLYRTYVTDMLMALVNSTGRFKAEKRFVDTLPKIKKEKEKTAEEIVADVIKKAGLTLEGI